MRGSDAVTGSLFSYVDLEDRVPENHPLRVVREVVNEVLVALDAEFSAMYSDLGRPSIAPERLLRGSLIQAFFTIRSERQLMEQLDYNLLLRWFVGLGIDDPVWDHSTYSKNRDRLLEADAGYGRWRHGMPLGSRRHSEGVRRLGGVTCWKTDGLKPVRHFPSPCELELLAPDFLALH